CIREAICRGPVYYWPDQYAIMASVLRVWGVEKSLLFALNHGFRTVTGAELFCYTRRPVRVGSAFMTALFLHGDENFLITTEKTGDAS
ncbi:MAG TPA: hypothetical protein VIK82_04635, partial [Porticoccaceae bacterium]